MLPSLKWLCFKLKHMSSLVARVGYTPGTETTKASQ
jgi:hypothetical protein